MKYNKVRIMSEAHKFYRDGRFADTFGECLKMAWENAKRIADARAVIDEEAHTYSGWGELGYEVIHGEHAVVKVEVYKVYKTKITTNIAFFTREQVCEIGTQPYKVA